MTWSSEGHTPAENDLVNFTRRSTSLSIRLTAVIMLATRRPKRQFSALATAANPISVRPAGGGIDLTTLRRIVTATSRRMKNGWTLDNLAEGIIVQAQEWSNVNSLNSTWSAQRCWLEFCASFEIEPNINERSLDERETIIVAFWAYMLKTIRPKRCARPAFKTLETAL